MTDRRCWGIYRESQFSLHRVGDDAAILQATARELEGHGFDVTLKTPADLARVESRHVPPSLFMMCAHPDLLERLRGWVTQGVVMVNKPAAILRSRRTEMLERLAEGGVPFPESVVVSTGSPAPDAPYPCWVKRGDVHRTDDGDVSFAAERNEVQQILGRMEERGIASAVVQKHEPGDLIKFYGVAPGPEGRTPSWFTWLYHRGQKLARHTFDEGELARLASEAASFLGLEIFGGDAIATADGRLLVIDVNAWPSFALYRAAAAVRAAAYLAACFEVSVGASS